MTDEVLREVLQLLRERKESVTTAESCTGGLLSGRITDIPGSSDVFKCAFVTYCDEAKSRMLHVRSDTLEQYTAVSEPVARQMAEGAQIQAASDAALSVTGYAGPGGEKASDSGLVYIGCRYKGMTKVDECHFPGGRSQVRRQAVDHALDMLAEALKKW